MRQKGGEIPRREQPNKPSEQSVTLNPNSAVIKLGNLQPIETRLHSSSKLDSTKYKILELENDDVVFYGNHSFLSGILQSFQLHKSITLSPDIIWLLIVEGFCYHVSANAEKLRNLFVSFEGKEELVVERLDLTPETATKDDWSGIVEEFVKEVGKRTKDHVTDVLEPKFSTTTPCSHTSGMISIMSAMKHYFDYKLVMCLCGFPSITLEGTVEDWELVKKKTESLSKYDLDWWTSKLIPILDEFIKARKGTPDYSFWLRMVRENGGGGIYEPHYFDGWLCSFFPYDRYGSKMNLERIEETSELASEILDTPFILKLIGGGPPIEIPSQLESGFFGVKETKEGPGLYNVKPVIGWGIKVDSDDELIE